MESFSSKFWKSLLVGALFLICSFSAFGSGNDWNLLQSPRFVVYFHSQDRKVALYTLGVAEKIYFRVTDDLDYQPFLPVRVYLGQDSREISQVFGRFIPNWAIGEAFSPTGEIFLLSPKSLKSGIDLREVLAHEFTHIVSGGKLGGVKVPHWFEEGLAMDEAGQWNIAWEDEIIQAVQSKKLISLSELDKDFYPPRDRVLLAYAESLSAFRFLKKRLRRKKISGFLEQIATSGSFELTLEETIGLEIEDFERRWEKSLSSANSLFLIMDYRLLPLFILGLTFLFVWGVVKYKNKRTLRKWDHENTEKERMEDENVHLGPGDY